MPRLIDSHCHIGSYDLLAAEPYTAGKLIEEWDKGGVACGVISVVGKSMTAANNLAAEAADKHPGRIFARIYLDPTDPGALAELGRCAADRPEVFRAGVKLHPSEDAWYPFHEQWFPLYEEIQRRGLSVLTAAEVDRIAGGNAARMFGL